MIKFIHIFSLLICLALSVFSYSTAQVNYSTSFNGCSGVTCGDWTISGGTSPSFSASSSLGYTPCNSSSAKSNIWNASTTTTLLSTSIGLSNGQPVTISFEGKVIDYNTGDATTSGYCTFTASWSTDGVSWTTLNTLNNIASTSCNAYIFNTFSPACGEDVYIRIVAFRTNGDFYAVFDDISVTQPSVGPSGVITKTCIGDYSSYDLEIDVADLDGSTGVNISIGATTYESNVGLGVYTITGLSGSNTVNILDVSDLCRGFTETFENCNICIDAPSLPANECADAPLIDLSQAFVGSTSCSYTASAGSPSVCGQAIQNDSWIQFIAGNTDVEIEFEVGDCGGDIEGIQLAVFSGSCGALTLVPGSCEGPGLYGNNANSTASWEFTGMTVGNSYYIRIDGYAGQQCDYSFSPISGVVITPDNDECPDATLLACGASDIASNILSTDTGAPDACSGGGAGTLGKGTWYTFVGDGSTMTISTDNAGTNFDTRINVYTATTLPFCDNLVCVGGDISSGTGSTSNLDVSTTNGVNYYIYVDGNAGAEGQFEINLTCTDCQITLSSAVNTDNQTLCINNAITNITYTTVDATGANFTGLPTGVSGVFNAGTITISGNPSESGVFNYTVELTGAGCTGVNATGTITVTENNTASAGSSSPTLCINTLLTNITHTTTGATGINVGGITGLPTGLSAAWNADVITISGTPSQAGTFNYSIPLTGGCGTVSATGTLTVTEENTASAGSSSPTLCINTLLTNITHTTTGATGINVGGITGLPTGLSAAWNADVITISGTPTQAGTFNYSIPLTGGCGTVSATGTITIDEQPIITATSVDCAPSLTEYSVDFTNSIGNLTFDFGTLDGGSIIDIPGGQDLTLTSTNGLCTATEIIAAPNCNCDPINAPTNPQGEQICEGNANETISVSAATAGFQINWYTQAVGGTLLQTNNEVYLPLVTTPGVYSYYAEVEETISGCKSPRTLVTYEIIEEVSATVSITTLPSTTICSGTEVTFTATPTNGGTTPTYQWYNGATLLVGETNESYTTDGLSDNDEIRVVMTSNHASVCLVNSPATSNSVTMSVTPTVTPTLVIDANPSLTICNGTEITFTAQTTHEGITPSYTWFVDGVEQIGETATIFAYTPNDGEEISVEMTSSETCVTIATLTETVTTSVVDNLTPSVDLTSDRGASVCTGTEVNYTATPTNGGTTPTYVWYVDGVEQIGETASLFTYTPNDGEEVSVQLTSNATCLTNAIATDAMVMTVANSLIVTATVSGDNQICEGTTVTYTANSTNGGLAPTYQWFVDAVEQVGETGLTFDYAPIDGEDITVEILSSETCVLDPFATNTLTAEVFTNLTVGVVLTLDTPSTVCEGTEITFTATPTNGGTTPTYQWFVDAVEQIGEVASIFTYTPLNGEEVTVQLTSNETCVVDAIVSVDSQITVTDLLVPSVALNSSPSSTVCSGTVVTFTAAPTNGGTTPTYEWFVDNVLQGGENATTFSYTPLDGETIRVEMTSNEGCVSTAFASNEQQMTISDVLTVSIAIDAQNQICAGTPVTYSAIATHGNNNNYQWYVGGNPVGANQNTYTYTPSNGDMVMVEIESLEPCVSNVFASDAIVMNVLSNETVSVALSSVNSVCEGTSVVFTATPTNGGSSPSYEWFVNGALQNGATAAIFTYTPLIGEVVSVELTSNLACALNTEATATSNLTINTTPSIQLISQSNPSSCGALDGEINISVTPAITGTYRFDYTVGGQVYSPMITITNGNATIFGGAGNYTNISLDLNGCTSSNILSASLTDPAAIVFTVGQAVNPTSCNGANGSFTISGLDSDETYSLVYNSNSPMNITSDNTGTFVVGNLTAGSYSNFSIQINGCTSTNSTVITLTNPTAPLMPSSGANEYSLCQNDDEITLLVTGEIGSVFTWYAADQTTVIGTGTTYVPSTENAQTVYYVTQTLNNCESNQLAITVSITATPEAPSVTANQEYCSQDAIAAMVATGDGGTFNWYLDAALNEIHTEGEIVYPSNTVGTTNYFVTQVINGCESEASQIVIAINECDITIPTAFTPNGDGMNDTWEILQLDELYPLNIVRIYNRWGTLIFEHTSDKDGPYYENEWNGRYNGAILPTGSYYFVIEFNNVAKDTAKGTVTLILD